MHLVLFCIHGITGQAIAICHGDSTINIALSIINSIISISIGCIAQLAERRSLAGELTLSCARPAADTCDHYVGEPSATGQPTRPTQPFILPRSINE